MRIGILLNLLFLFVCTSDCIAGETGKENPYLKQSKGEAWLDLMTGKIYPADFPIKPSGPILWGRILNKQFEPSDIIEFAHVVSEPSSEFASGWIDLHTGKIIEEEKASPQGLILRGRIDSKGYFHVYPAEIKRWMKQPPANSGAAKPLPVPGITTAPAGPILSISREEGFTIDLDRWWSEVKNDLKSDPLRSALSPRDLASLGASLTGRRITWDAVSGYLELFWLDSDGNICHGDPGVDGQPGSIRINGDHVREIHALRGRTIDQAELLRRRTDKFHLGSYQAQGAHLAQFSVWYARIRDVSDEDLNFFVAQTLSPIHSMPMNLVLNANIISPPVLHPSYDPVCNLSETGLPIPPAPNSLDEALGEPAPQHPTKCLRKNAETAASLIDACRTNILTGGLGRGYYRRMR